MSRIEQALRRARELRQPDGAEHDPPDEDVSISVVSDEPEPEPQPHLQLQPESIPEPQSYALENRGAPPGAVDPASFTRIVAAGEERRRRNGHDAEAEKLVSAADPGTAAVEQFRCMAATLQQLQFDRGLRILVVTSAASAEGKSLVASNLAVTLSRSYHRQVLLIDADLRRPGLHRFFGIRNTGGLAEAISHGPDQSVPVHDVGTRLSLLPAGRSPRDPVSMFSSESFSRLITGAAGMFDWVILDSAPVGMLPDASLLSNLADGVLFVVEAGRVPYRLVQRAVETVGTERIVGVVLNKIAEAELVGSYGYQYYSEYFQPTRKR